MSTVVLDDLRHEMDENVATSTSKSKSGGTKSDVKTSFLIRTLPKECNPTPVPTALIPTALSASASGLLSPLMNKLSQECGLEILHLDNPFDDITEDKLSRLTSFRDLGTSLSSLRVLWAMHCQISDLDGIGALTNLQELYLQHNNVTDISPLTMHDELRVVDLEGNCVADIGQIEQLAFCPHLRSLNLTGNSVETVQQYRQIVANFVPQLVSLDDRALSDIERATLSDSKIDAAIQKHQDKIRSDTPTNDLARAMSNDINRPPQLSYSSSTASLNGLTIDSRNDDSGSRLTHGTDIVFAGNVSSALRRHRHEAETGPTHSSICGSSESSASTVNSRPSSSHGLSDRPKTPAHRISITDTLDRARELDTHKHKSRDAILDELKTWQLDSVGTSQIGVPRDANGLFYVEDNSPNRSRSRRKGSIDGSCTSEFAAATRARLERRPNTSAGVLRNGVNVREAFVEMTSGSSNFPPRPSSRGGSSKRQGSTSGTSGVDILILDGGDDSKPPTKTPRGIFTVSSSYTKALGHHHDWNLDVLSSKVDITTAKRHIPTSLTSKQQLERSLAHKRSSGIAENDEDSDSDADDESRVCPVVATGSRNLTVPKTAFFNVAESLNAIEKWRDEMEYDTEHTSILSVTSFQQMCLSPRDTTVTVREATSVSTDSNNQQNSPTRQPDHKVVLGPGNHESDHQLVQLLRGKRGQLKTRDGFRTYFRGIEKERLENILHQAFADNDKVRRRMQLMTGLFRLELMMNNS
ncbi:hypothetical protein PHMEG_0005574 [Phytophthora megakarya]|uniref:Uncharacterized protein n=1 Tax=Phytophthora megakarya TaxID=4795 RepID=A0A225WSZ1_9STRA|nr:hypothetical protein PHMEG_0005574 [Phytophthora megakarya]